MGTVVVLAILAGVVALIVRKMIKDKKNGKMCIRDRDAPHHREEPHGRRQGRLIHCFKGFHTVFGDPGGESACRQKMCIRDRISRCTCLLSDICCPMRMKGKFLRFI